MSLWRLTPLASSTDKKSRFDLHIYECDTVALVTTFGLVTVSPHTDVPEKFQLCPGTACPGMPPGGGDISVCYLNPMLCWGAVLLTLQTTSSQEFNLVCKNLISCELQQFRLKKAIWVQSGLAKNLVLAASLNTAFERAFKTLKVDGGAAADGD